MDIKKLLPSINKYTRENVEYILPNKKAHLGYSVPEIVLQYGSLSDRVKSIPRIGRYLIGCIRELNKSYKELHTEIDNVKDRISQEDLLELKNFIKGMGISDIGFTEVDTSYIFSDKMILYKNAIVLLMEMNSEIINTAPSKATEKEIFRTYYELNVAVNKIKDFLNERGYYAEAGPALGGEVNYPLLAQKAGMGAIGKHGLLITSEFGPSLRLAAVYTNIENLPMTDSEKHLWIREFCNNCNRCVEKCPAKAIYKDTKIFADGTEEHIDYKKCALPFSTNNGCTICIKECTFFKNDYDKIKEGFTKEY
ncbi:MAG: reductive dehalogenase domain-containing protein [Gudongella sp.]|nr:reductive dehalogenase domain-containing protein [Gudongella sp.]